jgi:CubicO group peptidase (beta-lactamase class C family)
MKHDMRLLVAVFLFVGTILHAKAQIQGVVISGTVVSVDDQQPVSYAGISILGTGIGTATNSNGEFTLRVTEKKPTDTLLITRLGYVNKRIPLTNASVVGKFQIALEKNTLELKEVKIEYRDPLKIIQNAIDKISDNYLDEPHIIKGFYRMHTAKDHEPLQISEAVFDIYNFGYANKRVNLFRLVKARDIKNLRDFKNMEVGQSPRTVFNDDIVKHINSNEIFGSEGLKNHRFEVRGMVDFKGYPAYEIDFTEVKGAKGITYRGKVFIETKTYAFLYFDYSLSPEGAARTKMGDFSQRLLMKMMNITMAMRGADNKISYKKVGNRWALSDVISNSSIYIKSTLLHSDFVAKTHYNYVATDVDTTHNQPFIETLNNNSSIEKNSTADGADFWKDYNTQLPDFDVEKAVAGIRAINGTLELKQTFEAKARKLPKDPTLRIDSMLAFYNKNGQFNGTALVKSKGKTIISKSYGYADAANKTLADEQTVYRIGSLSKTFCSVIINQLIKEGKLSLQTPVKTYIPYYVNGDVTIEQLLTHQSGIADYFHNDVYKAELVSKSFSLKEMVMKFCSDTLLFKNESRFDYSNANFSVLALAAEEVTGKPFDNLLSERIFSPLQLADTWLGNKQGKRQAIGYIEKFTPEKTYDAANTTGAGGIFSSAADLAKFHNGLLTDKLLPKEVKIEMLKPRVEFIDYRAWYGYGWMIDKDYFNASKKHVITYHPGTDLGFFTMFAREENTDTCIILLNNTGDFPRLDITDLILNALNL